ncbi:HNH endonuclease signature motif containing protein [Pandoraea sp. XJJ-1]|uniref:HNH endonuclease signature motif containing protein n=1 Tax=Pandoraea sp. XJJ-1 TaxID=3002643 RepID=UPI002282858F|nr:HNH endonuclease signature motif containing protein [Pandoraea sp. XJJ-1]WAL81350.1 HNH endonuclease signature motif containing protein [Pandoraea sp. XJJ-1]
MNNSISQAELRTLIDYDPSTGVVRWKPRQNLRRWNALHSGKIAGSLNRSDGYMQICINKKNLRLHRVIWILVNGDAPFEHIDHINGNPTDNRLENLRAVTSRENMKNKPRSTNNTSGHIGVTWNRSVNKWQAQIGYSRRSFHLGLFDELAAAVEARKAAEARFGFHPNHGRASQAAEERKS